MLRCMGHIINLAQQAFICALTGGKDWLEASVGNDEEPDLSGLEESPVEGVLIGPLLAHMQALVVQVSIIHFGSHHSYIIFRFKGLLAQNIIFKNVA